MRSPARLALAVTVLLAMDVVLSWMVIQAAYIYLGMVWHGLAREVLPGTSLAEHARQFRILRLLQGGAWLLTAVLCAAWFHRVRRARALDGPRSGGRGGGRLAWCWALLLTAFGAELVAALLAGGGRLDLGGPMQALILAQLLEIAGAVVGIVLVRRTNRRLDAVRGAGVRPMP